MKNKKYPSALTIDVEDGINILMRDVFKVDMPPTSLVVDNVMVLLDLFEKKDVTGTFFILGEIAEYYPKLVRDIASKGHEIGVHGYYHDQIFRLTHEKARNEIGRAKALLEDITGEKVSGFRAPAFSVTEETSWILETLSEIGFLYDSSVMPVKAKRYGWPGFKKDIQTLKLKNGNTIIEVPLSVTGFFGKQIPACGGGYLRYFPYYFSYAAFKKIQGQRSPILYLHPYEIDVKKYPEYFYKAMSSLPLDKKIPLSFYRLNKGTVLRKLTRLIEEFSFVPLIKIIESWD